MSYCIRCYCSVMIGSLHINPMSRTYSIAALCDLFSCLCDGFIPSSFILLVLSPLSPFFFFFLPYICLHSHVHSYISSLSSLLPFLLPSDDLSVSSSFLSATSRSLSLPPSLPPCLPVSLSVLQIYTDRHVEARGGNIVCFARARAAETKFEYESEIRDKKTGNMHK